MSPSPKRKHQKVGRTLMRFFEESLEGQSADCNCDVYYELDWVIDNNTVLRPDVMIVCGKFETDYLEFPPSLVVEIISALTSMTDHNVKFEIYQENGVRFYLMVEPEKEIVEIFNVQE